MKVYYRKPIMEKILDAKGEADVMDKEIDYLSVTESEAKELFKAYIFCLDHHVTFANFWISLCTTDKNRVYGVTLRGDDT